MLLTANFSIEHFDNTKNVHPHNIQCLRVGGDITCIPNVKTLC